MYRKFLAVSLVAVGLISACSLATGNNSGASSGDQSSYCESDQGKPVCIMGGILLTALISGIIANHGHDGRGAPPPPPPMPPPPIKR